MTLKTLLLVTLSGALFVNQVFAADESIAESPQEPSSQEQPLINVKMMLDLKGVEQSINRSADAIDNLATSLTLLSKNESLNEEQQQVLVDTINNINELTDMSKASLEALPGALQQSQDSIANSTKKFAYDVRFNVLLLLGLIVLAIILALIAAYWFILRPMQGTILSATRNVSKMASAIHQTAESLETTTANQRILTQRLEAYEGQSGDQSSQS